VARRARGVWAALEHAGVDQMLEALGQDLARDPEVAVEVVEAVDPDEDVAHDERGPGLAGDGEAAGDRAGDGAEVRSLHDARV
jgi:hypothetical protein